jgi:replicative DNA helicase
MKQEQPRYDKVLVHDTDTEEAVLATIMRHNDLYAKYSDLLTDDIFYYDREKAIFRCIRGIIDEGGVTDVNSMYNYGQSHQVGAILEKHDFVNIIDADSTTALWQNIMRLIDMSRRRMSWEVMMKACNNILDLTCDCDEELQLLGQYLNTAGRETNREVSTNDDVAEKLLEVVQGNQQDRTNCLMTGFKLFDEKYLLRPNTLTVIAAFTSVGKSALAMNIVQAVAKQGIPVAYFSLEMSNTELLSRLISKEAGLPGSVIMNKKLNEKQMDFFQRALNKNKNLPIYYDDRNNVDFNRTMRTVKNMVRTKGIKLAVIDYLQIYSQVSDDVEQSISYMARTAKNVAIETGIPIILLSQLNRSGLHPSIKMLRGSGQIEESADNIVLIDRPDAYPDNKVTKYEGEFKEVSVKNTAKLILAKGRGVGTGCALVGFEGAFTRFYEVEKVEGGNYIEHKEDLPF